MGVPGDKADLRVPVEGANYDLGHGDVVIAAITSCTNTSNPYVMVGAGLVARKARALGLTRKPWVKTSLAPGSRVVTDYLARADLQRPLDEVGFDLVGYGCTTCIGNSGPLPDEIGEAINEGKLVVAAVLSGNRNFEGRVHAQVKANYLASPPLVVAYALAGSMLTDVTTEPLGTGSDGKPVYLKDVWPTPQEVDAAVRQAVTSEGFKASYADVFAGDAQWASIGADSAAMTYSWDDSSTYIQLPPYFAGMGPQPATAVPDLKGARILALLGDSITTDHISPAGNIAKTSPAARYLLSRGVEQRDFNQYGARRGSHDVMMRGTFANIRIKNEMLGGKEGGLTRHWPDGAEMSIYDAAIEYQKEGVPLVVIGGKEYGTGSSRDWAAKGTNLLGVKVVVAQSFERIHRTNLVGMGVLPLQFHDGIDWKSLGLLGTETFALQDLADHVGVRSRVPIVINRADGSTAGGSARPEVNPANPRENNVWGHIIRWREAGGDAAAAGGIVPSSCSSSSTSSADSASLAPSRIRRWQPRARGEWMEPGIAKTSRPHSAARRAVISDPLCTAASTTSTPRARPAISLFWSS